MATEGAKEERGREVECFILTQGLHALVILRHLLLRGRRHNRPSFMHELHAASQPIAQLTAWTVDLPKRSIDLNASMCPPTFPSTNMYAFTWCYGTLGPSSVLCTIIEMTWKAAFMQTWKILLEEKTHADTIAR